MCRVRDVTFTITVDDELSPMSPAVMDALVGEDWPSWVIGLELKNDETRPATEEERESMGWPVLNDDT